MASGYLRGVAFDTAYAYLCELRADLVKDQQKGDGEDPCDVRMGWDSGSQQYHMMSGDVCWDLRHYEHCAASSVAWNDTDKQLRATARELCDQIEDSIAEGED